MEDPTKKPMTQKEKEQFLREHCEIKVDGGGAMPLAPKNKDPFAFIKITHSDKA